MSRIIFLSGPLPPPLPLNKERALFLFVVRMCVLFVFFFTLQERHLPGWADEEHLLHVLLAFLH